MKTIILITTILSILSCKAQNQIVNLEDMSSIGIINGNYYKDIDNNMNSFEGTWKYENGNSSFTIKFRKIINNFNGRWYEDKLIGDYRYVENGLELVNTLPDFNDPNVNDAQHDIKGNRFLYSNRYPRCPECGAEEVRFVLTFYDTERKYLSSEIAVRHFTENGIEKIKVWLYDSGSAVLPYDGAPEEIRVPYGEYVLVKQ